MNENFFSRTNLPDRPVPFSFSTAQLGRIYYQHLKCRFFDPLKAALANACPVAR